MKITVERSGGFAGLSRTWVVFVDEQDDRDAWLDLVEDLPWGRRREVRPHALYPDRYVYRIRVSRHQITLSEQQLSGPWRALVDKVVKARG